MSLNFDSLQISMWSITSSNERDIQNSSLSPSFPDGHGGITMFEGQSKQTNMNGLNIYSFTPFFFIASNCRGAKLRGGVARERETHESVILPEVEGGQWLIVAVAVSFHRHRASGYHLDAEIENCFYFFDLEIDEGAWNSLKESPNFEPELVSSRVKHATKALTTYMAAIKTWLRPELDFSEVDEEE
ncbi:hypothetical protein Vadar_023551 [Vaccinium darrowii]|uniref:Uncharacterized protein n=1 Tax=Vaccinium darrowii TaxID=229202 RepID=A0ACB7XSJ9_9ERIC|nr:hypothetical protein Vadar_023551 [Vaccinium darrowii]